jgi:hypothetical protein
VILEQLQVDPAEFERRTGWAIKPEGACKGPVCVPLPQSESGGLDAETIARRLGMALVHDQSHSLWALGPESRGHALSSAQAPDMTLPDRNGKPFSLRSLRGTKVFLLAWASW